MKKKIVNGLLMMALLVSAMGTFVSCKDYDEDAYVDLRNRISNEITLREALQQQVNGLASDIEQIKALYATMAWVEEHFYTKEQVDKKFVTVEEFAKFKADCEAFKKMLNGRIDSLNTEVNAVKDRVSKNETDIVTIYSELEKVNELIKAVEATANQALQLAQDNKDAIEALAERVGKNESEILTLKDAIDSINNTIDGLKTKVDDLEKLIIGWDDKINELNDRIANIEAKMEAYNTRIEALENSYTELYQMYLNQQEDINNIKTEIENLYTTINEMKNEWAVQIQVTLNQAVEASNEAKELAEKALDKAGLALTTAEQAYAKASNAEQLALNALYAAQQALKAVEGFEEAIKRAEAAAKAAEEAQKKAEAAQAECEKILEEVKKYGGACNCPADLKERLEAAEKNAADAKALAEAMQKVAQEAKDIAQAAKDKADALQTTVDDHEARIKALEAQGVGTGITVEQLNDAIKKESDKLKDEIDKVSKRVDALETVVNNLKSDFMSLVTGITIQATNNPVIGYFNIPADARSMVLMTYFGKAEKAFVFPGKNGNPATAADADVITPEMEAIMTNGAGFASVPGYFQNKDTETYFAKDNGDGTVRMGSVFLTVNPTNVNFAGKTLKLENTRGVESVVELTPLKKSTELLTFGYDRTRAENGFYEATAKMPISNENFDKIRLSVDVDGLVESAKSAVKNKSKIDVVNLAVDFYKSIDNQLEANAIKATWTDNTVGQRSVISTYSIATTAVKPLSFKFIPEVVGTKGLPGKKWAYKLIEKIINQIKIRCPQLEFPDDVIFKDVQAKGSKLVVTFTGQLNGNDEVFTIEFDTDGEDIQTIDDILKVIVSDGSGDATIVLADLLNSLNNQIKSKWDASFAEGKANMISGLQKYIDKAYNKLNSLIQLGELTDIRLVAHQVGKGFKFVSEAPAHPTKVDGSVTLFPTSNTVEYFAPAYKKFVAVSNVFDASGNPVSDAQAKANAAMGENMGVVIDGDTSVTLNGAAGYTYEVTYMAVDYRGYQTVRQFYVQF